MDNQIYVLIACEESQAECNAFRELGFVAFSCDVKPCRRGGHPEWHICGDVTPYLQGKLDFYTQCGLYNQVPRWDLIIAHPPCTYMCRVSSSVLYDHGQIRWWRVRQMILARRFFFTCLNSCAQYIAVENPLPMRRVQLPKPSCFIHPSWFGVKYTKKTLYWLKNLPPIMAELDYPNPKCYVHCSRGAYRSRTFPAVARALAKQWSEYILQDRAQTNIHNSQTTQPTKHT